MSPPVSQAELAMPALRRGTGGSFQTMHGGGRAASLPAVSQAVGGMGVTPSPDTTAISVRHAPHAGPAPSSGGPRRRSHGTASTSSHPPSSLSRSSGGGAPPQVARQVRGALPAPPMTHVWLHTIDERRDLVPRGASSSP